MSLTRQARFDTNDQRGTFTGDTFEGSLIRKHTYEAADRKASNRAWEKLYAVVQGHTLTFYKDARHRQDNTPYHGEPPIDLSGSNVVLSDYPKRRNVISAKLPFGSEYLLQCADEEDLQRWLGHLQQATGRATTAIEAEPRSGTEQERSQTLPAESSAKPKKGGFFSRGKK
jgi:spectrin beta